MAKTNTTKKKARPKRVRDERGITTSVSLRGEAVQSLREVTRLIQEAVGVELTPAQVVGMALKNELDRRKEQS